MGFINVYYIVLFYLRFKFNHSENTTMNATFTCAICATPSPAIRGDFCRCRTNETWNPAETRKQPSKLQYRFFSFFLPRFLINHIYVFGQFLHEFPKKNSFFKEERRYSLFLICQSRRQKQYLSLFLYFCW